MIIVIIKIIKGTSPQTNKKALGNLNLRHRYRMPGLSSSTNIFIFFPAKVANSYRNKYLELGQEERPSLSFSLSLSLALSFFLPLLKRQEKEIEKEKEQIKRKKNEWEYQIKIKSNYD